jgi:hypothetical protein
MKRLAAALTTLLVLVLAPQAAARGLSANSGPLPYHAPTAAPTGLHAFLLRPDEGQTPYYPRTPSFAWNPVSARGGSYEFELATSRTFTDANVLFTYDKLAIPALAIDHQLPWMTGVPYALWAHVRWVSADGKRVTPWSEPYGFNLRWRDSDYPQPESAPPGMIRWKPVEGATSYEVIFTDFQPAVSFKTTTNVADEREYFTFHDDAIGWGGTVHWRIRAIRAIRDDDVLKNGLPAVSYGPWSKTFTTVNPPKSLGTLTPSATISDEWDKSGKSGSAHELTPGFAWQASAPVTSAAGAFGSSLYRVYISTDDHCVNTVFTGSIVGSPAFAPRTTNGPRALPQSLSELALAMAPPYATKSGAEGNAFDALGNTISLSEAAGAKLSKSTASSGSSSGTASGSSSGTATSGSTGGAQIDLWDSGWPTGRFYWTVVPVTVEAAAAGSGSSGSSGGSVQYRDTKLPQDSCEAGIGMSFGKVSAPVVTKSGAPWVSGLAPSGRYIASAGSSPAVHDSPLVAWQPAVGATSYEVEVSPKSYPWKAAKKLQTYGTAAVLPLGKNDVGTWWYRVRGVNPALPDGAQQMSWSKPVQIKITGDQFVVVK